MSNRNDNSAPPSLPQNDSDRVERDFELSLARTAYNYTRSYPNLENLAVSANIPSGEELGVEYNLKVANTISELASNFLRVLTEVLGAEFVHAIFGKDKNQLLGDLLRIAQGLPNLLTEAYKHGLTAFLRSAIFDLVADPEATKITSTERYEQLSDGLPTPLLLNIEKKPWMPEQGKPCEQDWYFGWLQVAGFNTTVLRRVVPDNEAYPGNQTLPLSALLAKMRLDDEILRRVSGDPHGTLAEAVRERRLYACDYALLDGAKPSTLHKPRYLAAPIAVFYWNDKLPKDAGFPESYGEGAARGVLQPIAIQLSQKLGADIFAPGDRERDRQGLKWSLAKYVVNMASVIHLESVAHLGNTHMVVEPVLLAAHRQLSERHPLLKLLAPHFRYTISINSGSRSNLIVPGGVVASNIGPEIASTLGLIRTARSEWLWDDQQPERHFELRGLSARDLPSFPFRDDTLPLWRAIRNYVENYLRLYYKDQQDVLADSELQAWVNELVSPHGAGLRGFNSFSYDREGRASIQSLDYLIEVVSQIIYIAGPLHASMNYAQYPLGAYAPAGCGVMYAEMPTLETKLNKPEDLLPWYPPLDIALYTISFVYLLSSVQYDRLGYYTSDPRQPYFQDALAQKQLEKFQDALAEIEVDTRRRNRERPMPYPFQLPSQIPNSISI